MLEQARELIREQWTQAKAPAVLCSFGKDSMLVLSLVREIIDDIHVIWWRSLLSPQQQEFGKRIIREWNLTAWSWHPSDIYLVPNKENVSVIHEQSFGNVTHPVLMDVEDGENCIFDLPSERTPRLFPHWDLLLTGHKDSDIHYVAKNYLPPDGWTLGQAKVYSPIRGMTDDQVLRAIKDLNVPYEPVDDTLKACTNCLYDLSGLAYCKKVSNFIPRVPFDRQASLTAFRERIGV